MALKDAIYSHLTNDSTITAFVSTRIYLSEIPHSSSLPAITFQQIGANHERHLNGGSGLADAEFQINSYSTDALEVENIADALRVSMDNHNGVLGSTPNTATVKIAELGPEFDSKERPNSANELDVYSKKQTWRFVYIESLT